MVPPVASFALIHGFSALIPCRCGFDHSEALDHSDTLDHSNILDHSDALNHSEALVH